MVTKHLRCSALAAGFAATLIAIAPAAAGPIATAGPLNVASSAKSAPVETVAYHHHYRHYHGYGAGAAVAGAALGIIGMAMANGFAGDCYDCGYGYGGPVYGYGGWGGGWHGGHFGHHFGGFHGGFHGGGRGFHGGGVHFHH